MIDVSQISKRYGSALAVNRVSLTIQPGEVVGLLGPNGAGKTTLLKMLTGYLPPTEGSASLAGLDVLQNPIGLRHRVGYLPETNPLYDELAVYESIAWTARLHGMPPEAIPGAIRRVVEMCGLSSVIGKDIGHLSKGYRQRVGLAQAILHDPEILILDEPTSGLDPNQQSEVRQLIQRLRQQKTVLLSTHILSEAQSACDRVLIIHRGHIVADGTPAMLSQRMSGSQRLLVELKGPRDAAQEALRQLSGVTAVNLHHESEGATAFTVESGDRDIREAVFHLAAERHWPLLQMTPERLSLEDVFRQLTTSEQAPLASSAPEPVS